MKIGLALGSGSSRGWAHIGVIRALAEQGVVPDIICGTSIGALVGAAHVAGNLEKLESWICSLSKFETASFFELNTSFSGFVNTSRLHSFLNEYVANERALIEDFPLQFGSVATDLESGREVWFTKGSMLEAVWASISLPGLFPAIRHENRWLVDGGLVNPVPVSVCRALGADVVIAVNLNGDIVGKHFVKARKEKKKNGVAEAFSNLVKEYAGSLFSFSGDEDEPPGLFDAIAGSVNIAQERITRSRLAGDPPEFLLSPKLSHIGLLEFFRAGEAIEEGKKCVQRMLPEIEHRLRGIEASPQ
ncbi:MAG: patatin-like phospholipase family protein [Desulfomicrobium sp.]|nr:patatin-like phospholipase family protein [Desulfomicrobium sp.]